MKREFIINLIFLLGINLLVKPFYIFGIDRTFQNEVGQESYGIYATLLSFSYLLQIVNDFGIQNFNNRQISQHPKLINKLFSNILTLKLFLSAIYVVLTLSIGFVLGFTGYRFHLLIWLAANQVLVALILYLRSNISGLQRYRWDSFLSAFDKLLMVAICSYLIWFAPFREMLRIDWLVYAQTASFLITAVLAITVLWPNLGKIRLRFRKVYLLAILKKSYPYALVIFLMAMYTRVDQVMIDRLLPDGAEQVGIYAASYRLLDASNMLGFLVAGLLLPMFAFLLGKGESIKDLVKTSFSLMFAMACGLAFYCFFFRVEIMELLYNDPTLYWSKVLAVLMFSFIAVGGSYVFGTLLTADGNLRVLNYISLAGLVVNIGLNIVLILHWKALGAAIATTVTQSLVFLIQLFWCHRSYKLGFGRNYWLSLVSYFSMLYLAGILVQKITGHLGTATALFLMLGIGSAWINGLISPQALRSLISQKLKA